MRFGKKSNTSNTTKEILIIFICWSVFKEVKIFFDKANDVSNNKIKSVLGEKPFNTALAREIIDIRARISDLSNRFPSNTKKINYYEIEKRRFNVIWDGYRLYKELASFNSYKTSQGSGYIIILLKKYVNKHGSTWYFDPFSDLENLEEEQFLQMHSYGPEKYKHISPLKVGDKLECYLFDPESIGYLDPTSCKVEIISVDKNKETIKISVSSTGDEFFGGCFDTFDREINIEYCNYLEIAKNA